MALIVTGNAKTGEFDASSKRLSVEMGSNCLLLSIYATLHDCVTRGTKIRAKLAAFGSGIALLYGRREAERFDNRPVGNFW
jgi:hypothetical protein